MNQTLLQRVSRYLKWLGVHPQLNSKPLAVTHFSITIVGIVPLVMEMSLRWKNVEVVANLGQMLFGSLQRFIAAVTLVVYRKHFVKIIDTITNQFWNLDKFDEGLRGEILGIHSFILRLFIKYEYLMIMGGTAYFLKPLLVMIRNERTYPCYYYEFCDIRNNVCYVLNYIWQIIYISNQYIIFLGFDGMFYALISHLYTELMLVKNRFTNLAIDGEEERTMMEFSDIVEHHDTVLRCFEIIQKILSPCFLWQFLGSFFSICTEIMVLLSDGFPPTQIRLVQSSYMLICLLSQIFFYCLVGERIAEQSESVAEAIYVSGWWKKDQLKLRKGMFIIVQRVRTRSSFTLGNITNLNIQAFAEVVKKTMTFFTFVKTMYEIQHQ